MTTALRCKRCIGDPGMYDVYFDNLHIGTVYCDADAWSYARWFIHGQRRVAVPSFAEFSKQRRFSGFETRAEAIRKLSLMQSCAIMRHVNEEN